METQVFFLKCLPVMINHTESDDLHLNLFYSTNDNYYTKINCAVLICAFDIIPSPVFTGPQTELEHGCSKSIRIHKQTTTIFF